MSQHTATPEQLPIIIVGAGMAGYTLVTELRKLNKDQPIILISADAAQQYAKPNLSNMLGTKKLPQQLARGTLESIQAALNVQILNFTEVLSIDKNLKTLKIRSVKAEHTAESVETLAYQDLVLAVGARQISIPYAGNAADHVLSVNSLADYERFHAILTACLPNPHAADNPKILIIGAGLIGCEFANDLHAQGYPVCVVDLALSILSRLLPKEAADYVQAALENIGIEFKLNSSIEAVNHLECSDFDSFYRVAFADGNTLDTPLILSAIGLAAQTELAKQTGLAVSRGIVVNEFLQTSAAHIYALGDCAEVNGHILPYVMPLLRQARALAKTLLGEVSATSYPAMPIHVKTPAMPLVILPPAQAEDFRQGGKWCHEMLPDGLILQAFNDAGQLCGFVLVGPTAVKKRAELTAQAIDLMP